MPKNALGARKNGKFKAVCTAPSFNKTPVGSSTPPLPYPTVQDLSNSVGVTPTVKFNTDPAYVLDRSTQPSCKGDNPGTAGGVKSGTVNGEVKPVKGSTTVRAEKKHVIRVGDPNTMNGGNNPGRYISQPAPGVSQPKAAPQVEPAHKPEDPGWLKQAAQYYQDNVSPAAHDFAGAALDKGGNIAAAGGATAAVGGGMVATGVGAAPGAVIAAAGGATAAVGGGVSAVGGIAETAATGLDKAAEFILTGKSPDLLGAAMELAQDLVLNRVTKFIPGLKGKASAKGKKPTDKKAEPLAGGGNNGVGVVGGGGGPCIVGPYNKIKDKCPDGQQAHHIIPDTLNRTSNRGQGAKGIGRIPGMPTLGDGPAICLAGQAKVEGSEHNTAHQADRDIRELAQRTDNGPVGTVPVHQAVPKAMSAAIAARPECKEQIEAAVRKAYPDFENDNRSMNGAGRPATGDAKAHLDQGGTADSGRTGRTRTRSKQRGAS